MGQNLIVIIGVIMLVVIVAIVVIHQLVSTTTHKIEQVVDKVQSYVDDALHPGITPYTHIEYPPVPDNAEEIFKTDKGVVLLTACIQAATNSYFDKELFLPPELQLRGRIYNYGIILEHDNYLIVAYRGSADTKDFVYDFTSLQQPFVNINGYKYEGLCHIGFMNITEKIGGLVAQYVQGVNKPIIFTGHSLGGCLAVLTLMYLEPIISKQHYLVTVAAPKFGDYNFYQSMLKVTNDHVRQIVNNSDLVPVFPGPNIAGYNYFTGSHIERIDFQTGSIIDNHAVLGYRSLYEGTCFAKNKNNPYTDMKWCLRHV